MGNTEAGVLVSTSKTELMHSIAKGGDEIVESELLGLLIFLNTVFGALLPTA